MKPLADSVSAKNLDHETKESLGIGDLQLMEKASLRMWDKLRSRYAGNLASVVAVCGRGDNGADALAILRHAHCAGFKNLMAIVTARKPGEMHSIQARSLKTIGITMLPWVPENRAARMSVLLGADLILDGIAGTGMNGEAENETADMIHALNEARRENPSLRIASVDLPSGLSDTWRKDWAAVKADLTLALEPVKSICYDPEARMLCGEILPIADVFPSDLVHIKTNTMRIDEDTLISLTEVVSERDYKMSRGRVSIFAGSESSIGAAILCSKAASAAGAGYVTLHVDRGIHAQVAKALESFVVKPIDSTNPLSEPCDTVLLGPGWGRGNDRAELLGKILRMRMPTILDADALRIIAGDTSLLAAISGHVVLTPHPGELAALAACVNLQDSGFIRSLTYFASEYKTIVIAKAHVTWIMDNEGQGAVWDGMQPELGTSGTGDILAGLVAGFAAGSFARKSRLTAVSDQVSVLETLYTSAIRAVVVHGLAGRKTAAERGWFEAADMLPACASIARDSSKNRNARP